MFLRNIRIDNSVAVDQYLYFFLEKIWDRMGIENPQNFQWDCMRSFYSLTYYLVNDIKIPNEWKKFTGIFFSKKELQKTNMNLVDAAMNKLRLKGSKVKQIFNEMPWVDFDAGVHNSISIPTNCQSFVEKYCLRRLRNQSNIATPSSRYSPN